MYADVYNSIGHSYVCRFFSLSLLVFSSCACVCCMQWASVRALMVRDKQGCHFNVKLIVWLFFTCFIFTIHTQQREQAAHAHICIRTQYMFHTRKKPTVRNDDLPILLSLRNRIKYKTNTHFTTFWLAIYLSEKENTRCSFHHILFIVFIFIYTICDKI